jgi:hypothetical protein
MALLATFEACVSSSCWSLMVGFIRMDRKTMMDENIGIPANVTNDRLQEV